MRVLIIEDDDALAGLIKRYLQPVSSSIRIARNMADAMHEIAATPPVELVTLDLALPDSSARETLDRIKEMKAVNPNCLLVVITGAVKPELESEALSCGADGFLHKTTDLKASTGFLETLADILRSIKRVPERYTKNLPILEKLTQRICEHVACNLLDNSPKLPQS